MADTVTAEVSYSFKGETHELRSELDARKTAEAIVSGEASLHPSIASNNGLDTYSYAYEVMETEDIVFTAATGEAARYVADGVFDAEGYLAQTNSTIPADIERIALEFLGVSDLGKQPALLAALEAAYHAGATGKGG